jgi:hypothetical protein
MCPDWVGLIPLDGDIPAARNTKVWSGNHGTGMRYLRERPAIRQQHFTCAQRYAAALERESSGSEGVGERKREADSGVYELHQERQDR